MDDFFVRNRLSAYMDGELSSSEAREVEAALARNPALRAEYEALRGAVEALRSEGPLEAPPRLRSALARRLAQEPMPSFWRRRLPRIPVEALALAAVAVAALTYVSWPRSLATPAPPEPAPVVATAEPAPEGAAADPATTLPGEAPTANGVLGDEPLPLPTAGRQSMAQSTASTRKAKEPSAKKLALEKEAYAPDWEQTEAAPAPTPLGSTAPYRYRLRTADGAALKTLAGLAAELGGKLVDGSGRALAAYPMDEGDSRTVRVVVPSYNVEALHARLKQLGDVETMAADPGTLYAPGADVPVAIEVQRD